METAGFVQRLTVIPGSSMACAWIGPTPTITELLTVVGTDDEPASVGAMRSSMVDALIAAYADRHEVVAIHGDHDARITSLRLDPA